MLLPAPGGGEDESKRVYAHVIFYPIIAILEGRSTHNGDRSAGGVFEEFSDHVMAEKTTPSDDKNITKRLSRSREGHLDEIEMEFQG
jgi:hypothetical protein